MAKYFVLKNFKNGKDKSGQPLSHKAGEHIELNDDAKAKKLVLEGFLASSEEMLKQKAEQLAAKQKDLLDQAKKAGEELDELLGKGKPKAK